LNPLYNPFSPGAGTPPPELAGRQEIIDRALLALERTKRGRSEKSLMLVGLRGVGKTVLLNRISTLAEDRGYKVAMIEAQENKQLAILLYPSIRRVLFALDLGENISAKVKRSLRVLKSFVSTVKLKLNDVELAMDIDPETGTADSGDLESDLTQLLLAVGEAAKDRKTAVALIVDELQYVSEVELSSLIMAVHKVSQQSLPLIVVGAGLPQLVGNAGKAKSYAERLFNFPIIGPLSLTEARRALQEPVIKENVTFSDEALDEIVRLTQGYPYFIQEWGYQSWNLAETSPISYEAIKRATEVSIARLDESFFRVRFDRLTPREKQYLRALAELGPDTQRSGEVAEKIGVAINRLAPVRNGLIKKGMIYSPAYGDTAFTVPLFDEFMKRTMPS
jgi:hypothetical protein